MKKTIATLLIGTVMLMPLSACSTETESGKLVKADVTTIETTEETEETEPEVTEPEETEPEESEPVETEPEETEPKEKETITLWAYSDEAMDIANKFVELHPDFEYTFQFVIIDTINDGYQMAILNALAAGGQDAPDIYMAESSFVYRYTKGDVASYACAYEDLGIDVNQGIEDADIAQYSVDIGTRDSDGKVVALGYESNSCVMFYRASIAEQTWGTSDPEDIKEIIGGGSGNLDKFWLAAEDLKNSGYSIVSGDGDIWPLVSNTASEGWIKDGKLNIAPEREEFLDLSMKLTENDYSNGTTDWTSDWYTDMAGTGKREVFAYFGPSWLINYIFPTWVDNTYGDWRVTESPVAFSWGGSWLLASKYVMDASDEKKAAIAEFLEWVTLDYSETGLQYLWANGLITPTGKKIPVTSTKVMEISDGSTDILGGQDMFEYFIAANEATSGNLISEHDSIIDIAWRDCANKYVAGYVTKEAAIEEFKELLETCYYIES